MAGKSDNTKLNIAFKKLLGKAMTGANKEDGNEALGSNVQVSNQSVFASSLPTNPDTSALYAISSWSLGSDASVEYVSCSLKPIGDSLYDHDDVGDSGDDSSGQEGYHAYALHLPSDYTSNSENPNAAAWMNDYSLTGSAGTVQFAPPAFGNPAANLYEIAVFDEVGDAITKASSIDWIMDYYNGIIFVQDIVSGFKAPWTAKLCLYIGKYQNNLDVSNPNNTQTIAKSKLYDAFTWNSSAYFVSSSGSSFGDNDEDASTYYYLEDDIIIGSEMIFANGLLQESSSRGSGTDTGEIADYLIYPSSSNETFGIDPKPPANSTLLEFTYPISSSTLSGKVKAIYLKKDS